MIYLKYLRYLLRHKWFVLIECFKIGLYWRGITHDMSKFLPSEFVPYARYFYGEYPSIKNFFGDARGEFLDSGVLSQETVDSDFDLAWLKHQHRNDHHWQHWVLKRDIGGEVALFMDFGAMQELVCDWAGAGKAIHGKDDLDSWYTANKAKMILHDGTRNLVECTLIKRRIKS